MHCKIIVATAKQPSSRVLMDRMTKQRSSPHPTFRCAFVITSPFPLATGRSRRSGCCKIVFHRVIGAIRLLSFALFSTLSSPESWQTRCVYERIFPPILNNSIDICKSYAVLFEILESSPESIESLYIPFLSNIFIYIYIYTYCFTWYTPCI